MGGAQSQAFPYDIGAQRSTDPRSLWTLHNGTKKTDGSSVSILNFDIKKNPTRLPAARNFVRRLKVLRHPYALAFIDSVELDTNIYVVTEQVSSLDEQLQDLRSNSSALAWGLYQITVRILECLLLRNPFIHERPLQKVIEFMNKDHNLLHGNLTTASVFINKAGDWKLGGFDLAGDITEADAVIRSHSDILPRRYKPPEYDKADWDVIKQAGPSSVDVWLLGCLYWEVFCGSLTKPEDLKLTDRIPQSFLSTYQQMLNINPKNRVLPSKILESKFFDVPLITSMLFLESINIKDTNEKDLFFKKLEKYVEEFPSSICKYKVLPALVQALDLGSASHKAVVPVLRLGATLTQDEYVALVLPSALRWFGAPDRAMRVTLLQNLESILEHFPPKKVNDIFLLIENGFTDSVIGLRELTVRSMIHIAPRLDERLLSENLLRHFARLQTDVDKGIRINTTICLGRIAKYLPPEARRDKLALLFCRPFKDPEAYARTAALAAFNECVEFFTPAEMAHKILPAAAPLTDDPDKNVRKAALHLLKTFTTRLEKASEEKLSAAPASGTEPQHAEGGYLSWALASLPTSWAGSITAITPKKTPSAQTLDSSQFASSSSTTPTPHASSSSSSTTAVAAASSAVASPAAPQAKATTDGWEDDVWEDYSEPTPKKTTAATDDGWGDGDWEFDVKQPTRQSNLDATLAKRAEKANATNSRKNM